MGEVVQIARKIFFSAAHRYYQKSLSKEENQKLYGSARHLHGHDYTVTCVLEGPIDPVSGLVVNLVDVDKVMKEVIEPMDQKPLHEAIEYFKTHIPSTENLAIHLYRELSRQWKVPGVRLVSIRVEESSDLWAEYPALPRSN